MLPPRGGFLQDIGGNQVLVIDANSEYTTRRGNRTGRRNNRYLEFIDSLDPGERIITSNYCQTTEMERLQLLT